MSWGLLGMLAEKLSPMAGSEAGAEPFLWLMRVPGRRGFGTASCLGMPHVARGTGLSWMPLLPSQPQGPVGEVDWGTGPLGEQNGKKKRCSGEHRGTSWGHRVNEQPPQSLPSAPPAMRSAMSTTPPSSSTTSTPPRAKASLTAGLTSWATSSRYRGRGHAGHRCPQELSRPDITISLSPGGSPDPL